MRKLIIGIGLFFGILFFAAMAGLIVGQFLPEEHEVSLSAEFGISPDSLWSILTNYESYPDWRIDLHRVDLLSDEDGLKHWQEFDQSKMDLTYTEVIVDRPTLLIIKIVDHDIPFGGTWKMEFSSVAAGCMLKITEKGTIESGFFRFIATYIFGFDSTIRSFINMLKLYLGEEEIN